MEYNFREREKYWQKYWAEKKTFQAESNSTKEKYYVLDMFPYPSGAGLHVGHPLGYIASDIVARYQRALGKNVLHPMGYDSFGLPAEQYAIQTGQHPAITTEQNIARYREQLDNIGFSFDWDREVRTSNPDYYKWTQWIFIQIFNSWYNKNSDKAEGIETLIQEFEANGNLNVNAVCDETEIFTAAEWKLKSEEEQHRILLNYRLTYLADTWVNWCPQLGTVLANEEVKDGVSERGGYPVERKLMKQWSMRITAYAERLLQGLDKIDWTESIKESQRNWIGKSEGASLEFKIAPLPPKGGSENSENQSTSNPPLGGRGAVSVFTTRPDTIFGVTFLTLAPEHELVNEITTPEYKAAVDEYVTYAKNRSERDRMSDVKKITGQFTGAYAVHPFNNTLIPIWIGDYVLAGYGTGAVMAVPAGDQRDYDFAKHFSLPIIPIVKDADISEFADATKDGIMINSEFLDGLTGREAIKVAITEIEKMGIGKGKINYRLRDAIFSRQRYWGEPIPVYFKNDIPYLIDEKDLPLVLPEVDKYLPTETGEPPLARATFQYKGFELEKSTMPGWAGSSWYFLRYMDAHNDKEFVSKEAANYWQQVDLYLGGSEHATGHLLYCRFWTKFLNDRGYLNFDEPAKKLINQGMIQGRSNFVYKLKPLITVDGEIDLTKINIYVSKKIHDKIATELSVEEKEEIVNYFESTIHKNLFNSKLISVDKFESYALHVDVNIVDNDILDLEKFRNWREEFKNAEFILEDGKYICGTEVEKMSKSKWNVVNPDDIVEKYGADCLRLYEMFLGPLELSKPWNTNGITGVSGFLKKFWKLFINDGKFFVSNETPTKQELKVLHKTIKKVKEDIERFSFNTSVSNFMICVNELTELKCNKREILEQLTILLSPYAPHIAEEVWKNLGHNTSITFATFPTCNESYLVESSFEYPISINGKTKFNLPLELSLDKEAVETAVLSDEQTQKYLDGKPIKKIIVVHGRIVNVVV